MPSYIPSIIFLFSINITFCYTQNLIYSTPPILYGIIAKIVDKQENIIDIGNTLILSPIDSSLVKGNIFWDGDLSITDLHESYYLLKITALGFEDYYQYIENKSEDKTIDLGTITLKSRLMEGVEVVARQKAFEQRGTDLIINVSNTALNNAGTALDVIQNSPKVFLNRSGQFSILGKGTAIIYIDGQRIASNQILSNLASNDIKQIEIIENPSAKYDAAGNSVINIITNNKTLEGYKIGLVQRLAKGKHWRSYFQTDGYYRLNKLMLQASYGIRPWAWGGRNRQTRTSTIDSNNTNVDNIFSQKNSRLDHNYSFRSTYQINSNAKFGLQYSGADINGDKEAISQREVLLNDKRDIDISSKLTGPYNQRSNMLNVYLQNKLDTLGSNLLTSFQFSSFKFERNERNEQILTDNLNEHRIINRNSNNNNDINIFTIQSDYEKHFSNSLEIQLGLKNAYITNDSRLKFEDEGSDGKLRPLPEFSNEYNYEEDILAAYSQIKGKLKSTNYTAGLRGEMTFTKSNIESNPINGKSGNTYFNLFPSASINQVFNKDVDASLNYAYRISRPLFQDLNPYVLFVDSLVSLIGNPTLMPEYSHSISGNIRLRQWNFNLNYTYTKNKINQIFRSLDSENVNAISFVKENLRHTKLYSASISRPIDFKWFTAYLTLGFFYDDHQVKDAQQFLINNKPGYYFQSNYSFQLPAKIKFDIYFNYTSSRVDGVYVDDPISYLNLSFSRKFFNNHLKVGVWGNDVFDDFKYTGISNFNQMYMTYLSEGDYNYWRISLNWDFGKLGISDFRTKSVSKSELDRINKNQ